MPVLPEVGSMMTVPGFSSARGLRIVNHRLGDAVLHGTGGVEIFQLGEDSGVQPFLLLDVGQLQ